MFHVVALVSLIGGLVNLYSPDLGTGTLLLGGWRTTGQTEDRIYAVTGGTIVERLRRPGALINDPTTVQLPDGSWRLYYTLLDTADLVPPGTQNERNLLGTARSVDGVTWVDQGLLVGQWNGHDLAGIWSPSALVVGAEVWVYAHTGTLGWSNVRLRFAADGRTLRGTDRVEIPYVTNVDVAPKVGAPGYWLAANTADLATVQLYESTDGVAWTFVQTLLLGNGTWVLTPHLVNITADGFDLLFGWTEVPGEWRSRSLHRWTWRR